MVHNAKNICRTVVSSEEQKFNKNWLDLELPYFFNTYAHFGQVQYFFKVLTIDFTIQYFQYHVGTLSGAHFQTYLADLPKCKSCADRVVLIRKLMFTTTGNHDPTKHTKYIEHRRPATHHVRYT